MSRHLPNAMDRFVLPFLDLLFRLYLGGVFLCAAWGKIINPYDFAVSIATYQMLPTAVLNAMAIILPWFELFAAIFLIVGWKTRVQVFAINAMLVVFMVAISHAVMEGLVMTSCGCFASEEAAAQISWSYVWRDVVWFFVGVFIFFVEEHRWGLDTLIRHLKSRRTNN